VTYVRLESPNSNATVTHTGTFGLVNGLARSGQPAPTDSAWWRANNDRFDAGYPRPNNR